MAAEKPKMPIESGAPDGFQYMHPTMRRNFGLWKYHERPRPGVLKHVAHSGDEIYTIRVGTARILDVYTLREITRIANELGDGFIRFTIRSNLEYMVDSEAKVAPMIEAIEKAGLIVGGTGPTITAPSHTQGWLHCDIPGSDASGVVKSMMDELVTEFKRE